MELWRKRDPLPQCRDILLEQHGAKQEELEHIERECQQWVEDAVEFARSSPDPEPADLYTSVYGSSVSS